MISKSNEELEFTLRRIWVEYQNVVISIRLIRLDELILVINDNFKNLMEVLICWFMKEVQIKV